MAFPLNIYGKFGGEKITTVGKKPRRGTRMELPDGRVFYYAFSNGVIGAGKLVMQKDLVTGVHGRGRSVAAAALGTLAIIVTNSGASLTKDKYADGTIYVTDGNAEGHTNIVTKLRALTTGAPVKNDRLAAACFVDEALTTA